MARERPWDKGRAHRATTPPVTYDRTYPTERAEELAELRQEIQEDDDLSPDERWRLLKDVSHDYTVEVMGSCYRVRLGGSCARCERV